MVQYFERIIDEQLQRALSSFGAVIIDGPRAVGKTTTALQHAESSIRLDASPRYVDLADVSPEMILGGETPRLIDEWQIAPTIWNAVRHEVDTRGKSGQFILTGSAVPADEVTRHSGAGRFKRIFLRPMTLSESGDSTKNVAFESAFANRKIAGIDGPTIADYARLIVRGGWPALVKDVDRNPGEYLGAYLDDVSRVDIPTLDTRVDPQRMATLLNVLARNISTEVSAAKIAKESEIASDGESLSAQTVRRYLDSLSRVNVLEEQPAWRPHLRSSIRLRVSPKWHFVDPSLAAAALLINEEALLDDLNTLGLFFESLAVRDIRVYASKIEASVYHYRDSEGLEVDVIVEKRDGTWAAFEVKMGGEANLDYAAASLHKLKNKVSEARLKTLSSLNIVTAGRMSYTRKDGVNVLALGHLF